MGSGYNTSLAVGRSARRRSSERQPIHFYLDVPIYTYELECLHTFNSRSPMVENANAADHEELLVWCDRCNSYSRPLPEPVNQSVSNDERIAFEQDKGIIRERIARALQAEGFLQTDEDLANAAQHYGIPVLEIKRINAGLTAAEGNAGPEMCRAGLHELTPENLVFMKGRRRCRACKLNEQRNRRAKSKIS